MSLRLLRALSEALSTQVRDDTKAVIIGGVDGCFSAGADLAEIAGTLTDLAMDDAIEEVTGKIVTLPVPVIAAIDGPCLGGAVDLALSCDVRVASTDAVFRLPATRLGLLYNPRSVLRMRERLGRDVVFRLLVLGECFEADSALRAGIVSRVVAGPSYESARAIAKDLTGNSRTAMQTTKRLLHAMDGASYDAGQWEQVRRGLLSSPERRAAVASHKKRRGR